MDGIEAELARLRSARRAAEESLEQERGRVNQVQDQRTDVAGSMMTYFRSALEASLADFGNRLRTGSPVGLRSVHLEGTHVLVPTDRRVSGVYADRREFTQFLPPFSG